MPTQGQGAGPTTANADRRYCARASMLRVFVAPVMRGNVGKRCKRAARLHAMYDFTPCLDPWLG